MEKKRYDPAEAEPRIQKFWEDNDIFKFNPDTKKEVFSVDTPPPTVSGRMHIGHAFSYSQKDFIVRFQRMNGKEVFYPFGTDDNGLPTERLVEKEKKVRSVMMERSEFVKLCEQYLEENIQAFIGDWKRIGISCDWDVMYSTIDEHSRRISQRSFIELYESGYEYRKHAPTVWCTECRTAISQVEMEDREVESHFNDIIFKLETGKDLVIATTRPEMLAACVAIFAHPDDDRYKPLFGKTAKVPLYDYEVPILADERADPEKGTGIVMCCTFGDQNDIEWYMAHNLPLKVAITKDGKMSQLTGKYKDMKVVEARKQIIEDLKQANLLTSQKSIKHAVNVHERCKKECEILESQQWFIKYLECKDDFLKRGEELNWFPEFMKHRYDNWIKGLQWDWCISRQRFFGVPFPVWYCKKCEAIKLAQLSDLPVDPLSDQPKSPCKCGSTEFEPEKDIMDTWATSSLTPDLAAELFKDHPVYKKLLPMSLRPQAHDIITFWLFNTVVKSHFHHKRLPWRDTAISGHVLDPKGKKMSKSLGNTVDPRKAVEKFSADGLRYWAASAKLGEDLPYLEKELQTGKQTVNKMWNASSFANMHLDDFDPNYEPKLELMDKWALSKLNKVIKDASESFSSYAYHRAKHESWKLFMGVLCDNYLEVVKDRLYNPSQRGVEQRKSGQFTLYQMLLDCTKLLAPFIPHITEEVYQEFFKKFDGCISIHQASWPKFDESLINEDAEKAGDLVIQAVEHARRAKSEAKVSLRSPLKRLQIKGKITDELFNQVKDDLKAATKAEELVYEQLPEDSKIDFEANVDL